MSIEMSSDRAICARCGTAYGRRKGYFPVSYAVLHKGIGYIPVCKECIDDMYNGYLSQCGDSKSAVRQMCRKLDLFWSENVFELVSKKSTTRSMMTQYIAKINTSTYIGKSYDDTLLKEGSLWSFAEGDNITCDVPHNDDNDANEQDPVEEVSDEVKLFWGTGLSSKDYFELEQRRKYWLSKYPVGEEIDVGAEALIRQICNLEIDINKQRAEGKPIDKNVNMLNTLLGSLNLKPRQRTDDGSGALDEIPFGVGIGWCEKYHPIKDIDPDFQDVDGVRRYLLIWVVGHLTHMLGVKNKYARLYEEEMQRLRVERPEYADEDEGDFLYDVFNRDEDEDDERFPSSEEDNGREEDLTDV